MKRIHPEDPRVTAYALGELSREEAAELEQAAASNPAVQEALDDTRQLAGMLGEVLGSGGLALDDDRREAIRRAGRRPEVHELASANRYRRWGRASAVLAAAAVLVVGGIWVLQQIPVSMFGGRGKIAETKGELQMRILLSPVDQPSRVARVDQGPPVAPERPVDPDVEAAREALDPEIVQLSRLLHEDPDAFFQTMGQMVRKAGMSDLAKLPMLEDNDFVSSREEPQPVVPMVSGRASYPLVDRFLRGEEKLPPLNAVRVEELVNHVIYQDAGGAELGDVRLGAEMVRCPWNDKRSLLGVLLRNESDDLLPVSSALQLKVATDVIRSYRLIGYAEPEDEALKGASAQRALPPGWSNYVLYELIPAKADSFDETEVAVRVGLAVGEENPRGMIVPVVSPPRRWENSSSNFKTASVLAAFGMLLRDSDHRGELEPTLLKQLAEDAQRDASTGDLRQREALQLVIDSEPILIKAGR